METSRIITFEELRRIKDSLPDGAMHQIAEELKVSVETIRNYFGGHNYKEGQSCGLHIEPGPDGGFVTINDPTILNMALEMVKQDA